MDNLEKYYFERLMKYAKHIGYIKASIYSIVMYERDSEVIRERLHDLLDKDARFDKIMYGKK